MLRNNGLGVMEESIAEEGTTTNNSCLDEEDQDSWKNDDYLEPTVSFESWSFARSQKRRPTSLILSPSPLAPNPLASLQQQPQQQQLYPTHRRQSSAPQPDITTTVNNAKTAAASFVRGHRRRHSMMPLTGDSPGGRRQENAQGRFGGWFGGNTATVDENAVSKTASPTQSRFGFLASSMMGALTTKLGPQSSDNPRFDDELLNINVEAALYPSSSTDRDTFSPAAYKNLQANATGLLLKMQTAYRQRTVAFQELEAERSAEMDEADEMSMRNESLKMQLEHMANKAEEQEKAMQQLIEELKAEKACNNELLTRDKLLSEGPISPEDLGVDQAGRKKWRKSSTKSEFSLDTDDESAESESVFSRSRSPTIITTVTESTLDLPASGSDKSGSLGLQQRSRSTRDLTAFQKFVKGISGETVPEEGEQTVSPQRCNNCGGAGANIAWDQVSVLRDENKWLKHRVAQLDVAVEGALDMVNGIGL